MKPTLRAYAVAGFITGVVASTFIDLRVIAIAVVVTAVFDAYHTSLPPRQD